MKRRRAFTIVELLVMVGILALLVSILIPAMQRARHPNPGPSSPVQTTPNVWVFGPYETSDDAFADDLARFVSTHQDLKVTSQGGANFTIHGRPQKYVVTTEPVKPR